jgi:hypothetical protein
VQVRRKLCCDPQRGGKMLRAVLTFIIASLLLTTSVSSIAAETPDGTIKITSRMVAPGIGLSWGDGVLTYKGQIYPFTFKANGLFRDVDPKMTAAELSGQVFNLKSPEDFGGNYHKVEGKNVESGAGSSAIMKNEKGATMSLVSTIAGRKFNLAREGLNIELKKPKP